MPGPSKALIGGERGVSTHFIAWNGRAREGEQSSPSLFCARQLVKPETELSAPEKVRVVPGRRLAATNSLSVRERHRKYKPWLKGGRQVAWMLHKKPGRSGKQRQEQNSPNLGTAF